jgi:hypothetical protein
MRTPEVRLIEVRTVEVRSAEVRLAEIRAGEVRSAEIGLAEARKNRGFFRPPSIPNIDAPPEEFAMLYLGHGTLPG